MPLTSPISDSIFFPSSSPVAPSNHTQAAITVTTLEPSLSTTPRIRRPSSFIRRATKINAFSRNTIDWFTRETCFSLGKLKTLGFDGNFRWGVPENIHSCSPGETPVWKQPVPGSWELSASENRGRAREKNREHSFLSNFLWAKNHKKMMMKKENSVVLVLVLLFDQARSVEVSVYACGLREVCSHIKTRSNLFIYLLIVHKSRAHHVV